MTQIKPAQSGSGMEFSSTDIADLNPLPARNPEQKATRPIPTRR